MGSQKKTRERRSCEPDFKAEILRMLISGKKVSEISETFGIAGKTVRRSYLCSSLKLLEKRGGPSRTILISCLTGLISCLTGENSSPSVAATTPLSR